VYVSLFSKFSITLRINEIPEFRNYYEFAILLYTL
jgi:hypothetical protein